MNEEVVKNLRQTMGTLPSEQPKKTTNFKTFDESIEVTLEDYSTNPYRAFVVTACSTWGDNEFKQKWPDLSPEGKLLVLQAVLTHKTLPQVKEAAMFTFRVARVPRLIFDYHTQTANFIFFSSQGCRDNNRVDADIIKENITEEEKQIFLDLKDLYDFMLTDDGSWQSARAFLPVSYCHSYHFGQNLHSITSIRGFHASGRFGDSYEEQCLLKIYKKVAEEIGKKFPLLELYISMIWRNKEEVINEITNLKISDLDKKDLELLNKIEL